MKTMDFDELREEYGAGCGCGLAGLVLGGLLGSVAGGVAFGSLVNWNSKQEMTIATGLVNIYGEDVHVTVEDTPLWTRDYTVCVGDASSLDEKSGAFTCDTPVSLETYLSDKEDAVYDTVGLLE